MGVAYGKVRAGPVAPQPTALSFWPGRTADLVHVPQRLPVRLDEPGLGVRDARAMRQWARTSGWASLQVGAGHAREEVVLDLVVQPAEEPVGDRRRPGCCAR